MFMFHTRPGRFVACYIILSFFLCSVFRGDTDGRRRCGVLTIQNSTFVDCSFGCVFSYLLLKSLVLYFCLFKQIVFEF